MERLQRRKMEIKMACLGDYSLETIPWFTLPQKLQMCGEGIGSKHVLWCGNPIYYRATILREDQRVVLLQADKSKANKTTRYLGSWSYRKWKNAYFTWMKGHIWTHRMT